MLGSHHLYLFLDGNEKEKEAWCLLGNHSPSLLFPPPFLGPHRPASIGLPVLDILRK